MRISLLAAFVFLKLLVGESASAQRPSQKKIIGKELFLLQNENEVFLKKEDHLILRYRYAEVASKPYLKEFFTPAGINVLRDGPADHPHHRGLMFACRANGVNFWEESPSAGKQVHLRWQHLEITPGKDRAKNLEILEEAVLHEQLAWKDKASNVVLEEDRLLTFSEFHRRQPSVFTWQTTLTAPDKSVPVTLSGAGYHGLGVRFLKEMDVGGSFWNSKGAKGKEALDQHAAWCAYTAEAVPGKPVTVAVFSSPANPRQPNRWYTKDKGFAYLSASLELHRESMKLEPDRPLVLRYGIVVLDGQSAKETLDTAYARWTGK